MTPGDTQARANRWSRDEMSSARTRIRGQAYVPWLHSSEGVDTTTMRHRCPQTTVRRGEGDPPQPHAVTPLHVPVVHPARSISLLRHRSTRRRVASSRTRQADAGRPRRRWRSNGARYSTCPMRMSDPSSSTIANSRRPHGLFSSVVMRGMPAPGKLAVESCAYSASTSPTRK